MRRSMRLVALLAALAVGCAPDAATRTARAKDYKASGDLPAAAIELKNVLQEDPTNLEARVLLAEVSVAAGDAASAIKEFGRAVDLGADVDDIRLDIGALLLDRRDWPQLLELLEDARSSNSDEAGTIAALRAEALIGLGRLAVADDAVAAAMSAAPHLPVVRLARVRYALASDRLEEANQLLEEMAADFGDDSRYWELKAGHATRMGDTEATIEAWTEAVRAAAGQPASARSIWLQGGLVEAHLAAGDLESARKGLAALSDAAPGNHLIQFFAGRIAFQDGNMEQALTRAQAAIAREPSSASALVLAGAAALKLGLNAQAEGYLASAVTAEPDNAGARQLLAEARLVRGAPDRAVDALMPAFEAGSDSLELLALFGRATLLNGDNESAIALYRRRIAEDPGNEHVRLFLAASLLAAGRNAEADAELAKSAGGDVEMQLRRRFLSVVARLRNGNLKGARHVADAIRREQATNANALDTLGELFLAAEERQEARADFERAVAADPEHVSARLNLGRVFALDGDTGAARRQFESVLATDPRSVPALVGLGVLAEYTGRRTEAHEWLGRARNAEPSALEPRLLLAQLYLEEELYGEAEAAAKEAADAHPASYQAANLLGVALAGRGAMQDARQQFERAAELAPLLPEMRYNLARSELALGDAEAGRKSLEAALAVEPHYVNALALLIELDLHDGRVDDAARRFDALEVAAPDGAPTQLLEGKLRSAQGRHLDAARAYRAVLATTQSQQAVLGLFYSKRNAGDADALGVLDGWLQAHPDDETVRAVLAEEHLGNGDAGAARAAYEAILATNPSSAGALNNLALLYLRSGDQRALAMAERAYALAPESGAVADTLGWIHFQRGDPARAAGLLTNAVELAPDEPEIRYHLAVVLADRGNKARARELLESILASQQAVALHHDAQTLLKRL